MGWEEAKQMLASGLISFGAHSVNHVILDQVSAHEAEQEIVQSFHDIHSHLGITPALFAYPNGNFTSRIKTILQEHGFKGAVTTRKGNVSGETDPFELPRIGIHQDISSTVPLLQARMHLKHF
jgi:peptidoglycan/xylan/chitin deacetylase (PgdA/CDA1 family)